MTSASTSYPNGCGQALGDYLATTKPLQASGNIWYVSSLIGTDAAAPAGKNDAKPLATLKQGITNSADGDIIVLMSGHTETSTADADWLVTKRIAIIGAGSSAGLPTVKLTAGNVGAAGGPLNLNTLGSQCRNIWFTTRAVANTGARVKISADFCKIYGCYWECAATDTGPGLSIGSAEVMNIENCTFVSTATLTSAQPESAIKVTSSIGTGYLRLNNCIFYGGTVGFSNPYAFDVGAQSITQLEAEAISLLRGADMKLGVSSTGWINVVDSTGGSRVDW